MRTQEAPTHAILLEIMLALTASRVQSAVAPALWLEENALSDPSDVVGREVTVTDFAERRAFKDQTTLYVEVKHCRITEDFIATRFIVFIDVHIIHFTGVNISLRAVTFIGVVVVRAVATDVQVLRDNLVTVVSLW